ncbi:Ldh family oxidoreductase [Pararhizobium sp. LjRoot255]|uniref:Ldh family oxidoreductase n=1 Tax=Pararhizobium sp. LjRoot255 TaxID=3342298 RepID=UPI003ECCD44D
MNSTARDVKRIDKVSLESFSAALLVAGGFRPEDARKTAELLVWANLRGAESHGVLRIPRYIEMAGHGAINTTAQPVFTRTFGAIATLDADRAPGAVGMQKAIDKAVELAGTHGIGLCSAIRITHAGAIGYFAEKIAERGMIGIAMTASKPLMIYHGARVEGVSTNPLAIAAPTRGRPLILDMSTAAVALGKIMAAKDAGGSIPADWGVDAAGNATTDPSKVSAVLPMSGPKGSGLSLMIEVLSSVLGGNPLISVALGEKRDAGFNGLVIAINPGVIGDQEHFIDEVEQLARAIKALPPAAGVDDVLLPGERGFAIADARRETGIPLSAGTVKRLAAEAQKYHLDVPSVLT